MLRYPRRALTLVAGGGGMSRQSSVDRMSSPGALTNQDMPPIPVVNDDDLDSYDQIYEGLFIGVLSFVLTVNPKGAHA